MDGSIAEVDLLVETSCLKNRFWEPLWFRKLFKINANVDAEQIEKSIPRNKTMELNKYPKSSQLDAKTGSETVNEHHQQ